jgi:adenylylsulfate kinase
MYTKAREGIIPSFTGISAPYEAPERPEIHLRTDKMNLSECVSMILDYLEKEKYVPSERLPEKPLSFERESA